MINSRLKQFFSNSLYSNTNGLLLQEQISKIMMYMEDLAVFCEAFSTNVSFYSLLTDENIDLGKLIGKFYANNEKKNLSDIFKMMCYIPISQIKDQDQKTLDQIRIHMESNAAEFQRTIISMRIFGSTNHKLFKRYKHGGMTIICDPPLDRNEDFLKKFETFNAVIVGNDPLKDLIMIPFSEKVKESSQILIHGLQKIITEIVSNRISCILRRVPGIIPLL